MNDLITPSDEGVVSTRLVLPLNLPPLKGDDAQREQIKKQRDAVVRACAPDAPKPKAAEPAAKP